MVLNLTTKNIHLGFKALSQTQVVRAHLKPATRLLVKIQASPDFDDPTVVQADFPIVHVRVEFDLKLHIHLEQALLQLFQLLCNIGQLRVVVVSGDEVDLLHRSGL
ncbi:hypothetical protein D3C80_1188300 [compost metagenome]